jgi:ferredoxin
LTLVAIKAKISTINKLNFNFMKRKIIQINEERCNGCGLCTQVCAEAALEVVNGKATLVKDFYCDGMGACLDVCPVGALAVVEKESEAYNVDKTVEHVEKTLGKEAVKNVHGYEGEDECCADGCCSDDCCGDIEDEVELIEDIIMSSKGCGGGCSGGAIKDLSHKHGESGGGCCASGGGCGGHGSSNTSELSQWPIQLHLVTPTAPYFENADIVISADCAPFAFANFHERFLKGKKLIIFCPKLDEGQDSYIDKLTELFKTQNIKSVTIVRMEVPCCGGVERIVEEALNRSGVNVLIKEYILSLEGGVV